MGSKYLTATILLTFCLTRSAEALLCYTCTAMGSGTACEVDPDNVSDGQRECDKKYCTLRRVEDITTMVVTSFYRGCEDKPLYMDAVIEDEISRTYFRACNSPLCNDGSGRDSGIYYPSGGDLPPGVVKPPLNMAVFHSGAKHLHPQVLLVSMLSVIITIYFL